MSQDKLQEKFRSISPTILFVLITGFIAVLVGCYTGVKQGWFYEEPTITINRKVADDAPVLVIATDKAFKPRSYVNDNNECVGSDVEMAMEAAYRLGMRPEVKYGNWLECRDMLSSGKADVLLGLEIFSNMKGVCRTIPILHDRLQVYGKTRVTDAAALAGKKVSLMGKSVIMANYELNCHYVEYYTNKDILKAAEEGKVDFAICHATVADNIIKENGYKLKKGFTLAPSFPAFAVREDNVALRDKLNKVLSEMSADGTIHRVLEKWLTAPANLSIKEVVRQNRTEYLYFLIIFIVMEAILGLYVLQNRNYRKVTELNKTLRENEEQLIAANNKAEQAIEQKDDYLEKLLQERQAKEGYYRPSRNERMTGLLHKVAFLEDAAEYLKQNTSEQGLSVIFLDIDKFKDINDNLGHLIGDKVIIKIADIISSSIRQKDFVCRYGGDEFVILMKDVTKDNLIAKLEALHNRFQVDFSNDDKTIHVTCSIGAVYYKPEQGEVTIGNLIKQADQCLYLSKEKGRDRFEYADYKA